MAENATPLQARYYPALDGLRFVAFLMVFVHHSARLLQAHPADALPSQGATLRDYAVFSIFHSGAYGVPVFFVLSSFLITNLILAEQERTGGVNVRDFFVRRALRIWPLYFIVLTAATGLAYAAHGPVQRLEILGYSLFFGNWVLAKHSTAYYSALWSISVEEQFYLFSPFVLRNAKRLERIAWSMIVVAVAYRLGLSLHHAAWPWYWYASLAHLDSFAIGALLAIHLRRTSRDWKGPSPAASGALLVATLAFVSLEGRLLDRGLSHVSPIGASVQVLVPVAVAVLIAALVGRTTPGLLGRPGVAYLGRISFGLYLFHFQIILWTQDLTPNWPLWARLGLLLADLAATIGVAALSYRCIERPFLRLKARFSHVSSRPET